MILVVAETHASGEVNPASLEAIAAAQQLGTGAVCAALLGGDASAVAALTACPIERLYHGQHPSLATYSPDVWVQALVQIYEQAQPTLVLLAHTYQARDFAPQLATRLGGALISDVTGVKSPAIFIRPMYQGKLAAEVSFRPDIPGVVTVQIGAFNRASLRRDGAPAPVTMVNVTPDAPRIEAGEIFTEAKQAIDLSHAPVIVAVGRGIKDPKNLDMARQLAAAMGAELAASRPICDSGWLPMDRQVGSSGQTVAPKLYLAVGISGAIQHLVGMRGSRTVVAINKDPDAPIFEIADYGVVGDLFEVVPALIAALQASPGAPPD
jgi:electron transfer flavoprotein alpha subunit